MPLPKMAGNQLARLRDPACGNRCDYHAFPTGNPRYSSPGSRPTHDGGSPILGTLGGRDPTEDLLFFSPAFLAYVVALDMGGVSFGALVIVIRAFFFGYATVLITWHILRAQRVTGDTIAGAACAYALTGVTWANFYELLEFLRPGSFDIPPSWLLKPSGDPLFALQYFSFTTLTTVG